MKSTNSNTLSHDNFIRHKLYDSEVSNWRRYALLVTGTQSIWQLLKYEIITLLFGPLPGALGLKLRQIFYPSLFRSVGQGVVFGRNIVVRNASKITLGDRVIIDDNALLDARGAGDEGIVIGDEVVLNRDVMIVSKVGPIQLGSRTDIGTRTVINSTGGVQIGNSVSIAGECKLGGVMVHFDETGQHKEKVSNGPIIIADDCTVFMSAIVLDGVRVGRRSMIGAGLILREDVPEDSIVAAHQKLVYLKRDTGSKAAPRQNDRRPAEQQEEIGPAEQPEAATPSVSQVLSDEEVVPEEASVGRPAIISAVYEAISEINHLRTADEKLALSLDTQLAELESMDKVNLIVETEQKLEETFGIRVNLSDYSVVPEGRNPFETVQSFVDQIEAMLVSNTEH